MKLKTFKGGIYLCSNKEKTRSNPIKMLDPVETMVFPMQQHRGVICDSLVKKGDYVKMWQRVGDSSAFMSTPIHSSVSGEVAAVEPRPAPGGRMVNSVVIKNDFKDDICEEEVPKYSRDNLAEVIRAAGIVGMGGACFPTHIKVSPPAGRKIEMIIVNGAECEPYLTSDHRVMLETPEEVLDGLEVLLSAMSVSRGVIAVENDKPDAINVLRGMLDKYSGIEVRELTVKYPQGSEKQVIKVVSGRRVPSGGLPADVGVIVVNVDTCTAIYRAAKRRMPLARRIVTVSGTIVKQPANFSVRLGMPVGALLEAAGGTTEPLRKLVMGGPMMGQALSSLDAPVIKGTSALLAFGEKDIKQGRELACIRCSRCIRVCPMGLNPAFLCTYSEEGDWEASKKINIMDCFECGSCDYVCPSKRRIVQSIQLAKSKIWGMEGEKN